MRRPIFWVDISMLIARGCASMVYARALTAGLAAEAHVITSSDVLDFEKSAVAQPGSPNSEVVRGLMW